MSGVFNNSRSASGFLVFLCLVVTFGSAADAQIPEEFTNLKILPEDISQQQLTGIMRGFATALDVRCNHCHVGESPDSLQGYDFASDEKETKRTARVMLKMTAAINTDFMSETGRENPAEVQCLTCHRGVQKPETLGKLVIQTIAEEGVDAAVVQYRDLRSKYYGSAAYDFGPAALDTVTEVLAMQKNDYPAAMTINQLNLEFNPQSDYTLFLHSRLLLRGGDRDGAIAAMEKAVAANPEEEWLEGQLEELKNPPPPPPN